MERDTSSEIMQESIERPAGPVPDAAGARRVGSTMLGGRVPPRESVARIGHGERSVRARRELDPVPGAAARREVGDELSGTLFSGPPPAW